MGKGNRMQQDQERQEQVRRRPIGFLITLLGLVYVFVIASLIIYGYVFEVEWLGISTKTFWDWLVLLLPAAAAAIGVYWQVERTSLERREPGIADLRAQDEALQEYLDQMTQLLLERDLRNSASDSEVRYVARARTLTALDRLNLGTADAHRERRIIQFLHELRLVQGSEPIISLHAADLSDADLHELDLSRINLWSVDLTGATGMTKSSWSSTPSHLRARHHARRNGARLSSYVSCPPPRHHAGLANQRIPPLPRHLGQAERGTSIPLS